MTEPFSRARRLKALTHEVHDRLDQAIMAGRPFDDWTRYAGFVRVQHAFHRDIAALYDDHRLQALLPDLEARRRLEPVTRDLEDLDASPLEIDLQPRFQPGEPADLPVALGWLYVAEGSNMGAALLRKRAARIGLSDDFGARHLARAEEGLAAHWRTFTGALDAVVLDAAEEARVAAGATEAFDKVRTLVRTVYGEA